MFQTIQNQLAGIRRDLQAVVDRDPATKSALEAILCSPGLKALTLHRVSHAIFGWGPSWRIPARMLSQLGRFFTGIEIHPGATIGDGVMIDHGLGVVIGETAIVEDGVTLFHGVTLGGRGREVGGRRHPHVRHGATVYAGAKVLGPVTVGEGAIVGADSLVLEDVPAGATVVGVPAREVQRPPR